MKDPTPRIDYTRAYALVSLAFLLLGLSPISRVLSLFSLFEPEFYFIPQYIPYVISIAASVAGLASLRENKSKLFVAAMGSVFKFSVVVSLFMVGYFLVNYAIVLIGGAALPEYCVFQGNVECQSAWLDADGDKLYLSLVDGISRPVVVTHASCTMNRDQLEPCDSARCRGFDKATGGVLLKPGEAAGFFLNCNDEQGKPVKFSKGDHYTGKLVLGFHYADEPRGNARKIVGSIGAKGS